MHDFTFRVEMNSSLDRDFEEFRFTEQKKIYEDEAVDDLQKFGMFFSEILNAVYDGSKFYEKINVILIIDSIKA